MENYETDNEIITVPVDIATGEIIGNDLAIKLKAINEQEFQELKKVLNSMLKFKILNIGNNFVRPYANTNVMIVPIQN